VDNAGDVVTTTHPTGAASSWSVRHVDGSHELTGISCHSTTLCVAVDNAGDVVTTTGLGGGTSSWSIRDVDGSRGLNAVSCPSTTLCVAVDSSGFAVYGTAAHNASRTTVPSALRRS
jgi:hypothetical protein